MCVLLCTYLFLWDDYRTTQAQNPVIQQHPALDAELLGNLDKCFSTNLQRQTLPQPQAGPEEVGSALQTDVLHSCLPTTTSKCFYKGQYAP